MSWVLPWALLIGCQFKKDKPIQEHQGPSLGKESPLVGTAQNIDAQVTSSSLPLNLDFAPEDAHSAYETYKKQILEGNVSQDPGQQASNVAKKLLKNFLDSVVVLKSQKKWQPSELTQLMQFFGEDCNFTIKTCSRLPFFSQDARFADLILDFVSTLTNWKNRYFLLTVAMKAGASNAPSERLLTLWFNGWVELVGSFVDQKDLNRGNFSWFSFPPELKSLLEVTSTIMQVSPESTYVDSIKSKSKIINKWMTSSQSREQLGTAIYEKLQALMIAVYFNETDSKDIDLLLNTSSKNPESHFALEKLLFSNHSKPLSRLTIESLDQTKLTPSQKQIWLLIEKSLLGASDFELQSIWQIAQYDLKFFLTALERTIQTEIIYNSLVSHKAMGEEFSKLEKAQLPNEQLFFKMVQDVGVKTGERWGAFSQRLYKLKLTFDLLVSLRKMTGNENFQDLKLKGEGIFDNAETNIRLLTTGPASIMLTYIASVKNFNQKIYANGLEVNFTDTVILDFIFNAQMPLMYSFSFGEKGTKRLDLYEIMVSFDYLIKLGVLDFYSVNEESFFREFFSKSIDHDFTKVNSALDSFSSTLASSDYLKVAARCEKINKNLGFVISEKQDIGDEHRANLRTITDVALFASSTSEEFKYLYPEFSVYPWVTGTTGSGFKLDQIAESYRVKILNKLRVLRFFKSLTPNNNGSASLSIQKRIDESSAAIENKLLKIYNVHQLIRSCNQRMFKLSVERAEDLTQQLETFLGDVQVLTTVLNDPEFKENLPIPSQSPRLYKYVQGRTGLKNILWKGNGVEAANNWVSRTKPYQLLMSKVAGLDTYRSRNPHFVRKGSSTVFQMTYLDLALLGAVTGRAPYSGTIRNSQYQIEHGLPVDLNQYLAIKSASGITVGTQSANEVFLIESLSNLSSSTDRYLILKVLNNTFDWFSIIKSQPRFIADLNKTLAAILKSKASLAFTVFDDPAGRKVRLSKLDTELETIYGREKAYLKSDLESFNLNPWQRSYLKSLNAGRGFNTLNFDTGRRGSPVDFDSGPDLLFSLNISNILYLGIFDQLNYMVIAYRLGKGALLRGYDQAMDCQYMECAGNERDKSAANRSRKVKEDELIEPKDFFRDAESVMQTLRTLRGHTIGVLSKQSQENFIQVFAQPIQAEIYLADSLFKFSQKAQSADPVKPVLFMYNGDPIPMPYLSGQFLGKYLQDIKIFNRKTDTLFFPPELATESVWKSTFN